MSQLTLLLLQGGFLVLLWFFVFGVVYSLRADLFGVKVRKLPEPAAPPAPAGAAPVASPDAVTTQVKRPAAPAPAPAGSLATTSAVSRIVITSGPKAGLELPLGTEPLTIGRSSESGLVIRDDYTSSHHARLVLWGDQWMLQDLDSTNGTTHDGVRVAAPVQVKVGAPIKVGATTFELRT
ncbi:MULTISPECIES: FHA domain-containing protein [Microbacterium]|uniref:FHA domain-containing protein FhaB/FipA n=1 Tax=Microbacterium TaxID=33882 RepID=UPI00278AFDE6|nr:MULTISPECIES: FHA domain-containing protein [Microbacterium]MDQ1082354.1 hypothetical protein [Microbacterium sp. SORGH_AS_0344]MDQ1168875.1 hypothetical protein [Microbacterium proteolyticum]